MASAGKVSPITRGVYNSSASYTRLDVVTNTQNSVAYIAKKDSINIPLDNTEYWQVLLDLAKTASEVDYDNSTSELTAENVQDAIDELANNGLSVESGKLCITYEK